MRRILVESAGRKGRLKRGGRIRLALNEPEQLAAPVVREGLLALTRLAADPQAARLDELRYFGGLPVAEEARSLGVSPRTADRLWAFARA